TSRGEWSLQLAGGCILGFADRERGADAARTYCFRREPANWSRWHWNRFTLGPQARGSTITVYFEFPLWVPALAILAATVIAWLADRPRPGHCAKCGYTLAGLLTTVCPECGTDASMSGGPPRNLAQSAGTPTKLPSVNP